MKTIRYAEGQPIIVKEIEAGIRVVGLDRKMMPTLVGFTSGKLNVKDECDLKNDELKKRIKDKKA